MKKLTDDLGELSANWSLAPLVTALQAMRGIEMVSAVTIVAEIGDFGRFATAGDLMGFVGLIPSEHTTGTSRRLGPITKQDGEPARPTNPGGVGLALPSAAADEQGDPVPQRAGVGRCEGDCVEGPDTLVLDRVSHRS